MFNGDYFRFTQDFKLRFLGPMTARKLIQQSGACEPAASSVGLEVVVVTAALRWLSGTNVTMRIKMVDYRPVLHGIQNGYV